MNLYKTKQVAQMFGVSIDVVCWWRIKLNMKPIISKFRGGIGFLFTETQVEELHQIFIDRKVIPSDWTLPKQEHPKL